MSDRGRILSESRADGLEGVAVGDRVEIDGSGPAFVTGLAAGSVELAPLRSTPPRVGADVRAVGPLSIPVGEGLPGRSIDPLGQPLDGKGPIKTGAAHPLFFRVPTLRPDARHDRMPLGLWVYDLKQAFRMGTTVLAAGEAPAVLRHMVRHHARSGRVPIVASLAGLADASAITVAAGSDASPAARWLVPWAAMAVADHFREQGRDAVVVLDSLDRWKSLGGGFEALGSWRTHLGRLLGHAASSARGSAGLIAAASLALAPSVEPMFDGAIDLDRALEGMPVPDGGSFVRPAIKIRPPNAVGRVIGLLIQRSDAPEARRAREALRFRPGMSDDFVAELAGFLAACELEGLAPGKVPAFLDAFVTRVPSDLPSGIRTRGELREEELQVILDTARRQLNNWGDSRRDTP
jgi:hypothetical protein